LAETKWQDRNPRPDEKLKPCPFCGKSNLVIRHDARQWFAEVGCCECGARGGAELIFGKIAFGKDHGPQLAEAEADAIEQWNRREAQDA